MSETLLGIGLMTALLIGLAAAVLGARGWLLPRGMLGVTVNGGTQFSAKPGSQLLDALLNGGIAIPAACGGSGTCGLCRVVVVEGGGLPLPTETARLTRRDLREGWRLACQVRLRVPIAVNVSPALFNVARWVCSVRSTRQLSPLIRELVLDLPEGKVLDFRPGAFVQVTAPAYDLAFADIAVGEIHDAEWSRLGLRAMSAGTPEPTTRAYSIANRPEDTAARRIVLLVRLALPPPAAAGAPPGIVSSYLFGLKPGGTVAVDGPYGDFAARPGGREMVFIGGGVGMAPLRAIIVDQLERGETARKMSFWYGARSRADLFYNDEFEALARSHPNFRWTPALSDPAPGDFWDGATGFVHDVVLEAYLRGHPEPEACEYYLCGPPLMIKAVLAMLDSLGVDEASIYFDDFGS